MITKTKKGSNDKLANEDITRELKAAGLRASSARVLILLTLRKKKNHPSAQTVFNDLRKMLPGLSKTSVYNTMKVLREANLIREVPIEDGELRYDAATKTHGHFKCEKCGSIYDFEMKPLSKVKGLEGFKIIKQERLVYGLCPKCISK